MTTFTLPTEHGEAEVTPYPPTGDLPNRAIVQKSDEWYIPAERLAEAGLVHLQQIGRLPAGKLRGAWIRHQESCHDLFIVSEIDKENTNANAG